MSAVPNLIADNMQLYASAELRDVQVQGRTLHQLRRHARDSVFSAAKKYTASLTETSQLPETINDQVPLIVGGHQPALFHTGVWAKNFSLQQSAVATEGIALNLVIDNDTLDSTRVRFPAGTRDNPHIDTIAFDADRPSEPWEDARILNADTYQSFATRCTAAMLPWNIHPVIADVWPQAVAHAEKTHSLRDSLTCARVSLERKFGVNNLELPLSQLCETEPFLRFASHILAHLPRFQDIHNKVLNDYRVVNRVRSKTHPVPELTDTDDWVEAPFWMWRPGDKQRRHVFARQLTKTVQLSDGVKPFAELPLTPEMDACCAIEELQKVMSAGIRFRTRALTTTLFARLFLSDLFVHGIGGAKYDEMTDRIISEFFGIPAPEFQVVSATLHLPFAAPFESTVEDLRKLQHQQRDARYNAQRHLKHSGQNPAIDSLLEEKRSLISAEQTKQTGRQFRGENYDRFRRLREINRQLMQVSTDLRDDMRNRFEHEQSRVAANSVIQNREFSFALFGESDLRRFFQ